MGKFVLPRWLLMRLPKLTRLYDDATPTSATTKKSEYVSKEDSRICLERNFFGYN